jgi:hypothetical protein
MSNDIPGSFVLLVTYPRSGSTVLAAILNTIPGYDIRGENGNALFHIWKCLKSLRDVEERHGKSAHNRKHPLFGCHQFDLPTFEADCIRSFADNVLTADDSVRVRGFKEVRYTFYYMTDAEFDGYATFLLDAFPDSRIVFNRRDPESVSRSRFWRKDNSEEVVRLVKNADERFARVMASSDRAFCVDYEAYTSDPSSLSPLFDFLGQEFDVERVKNVLQTRLNH